MIFSGLTAKQQSENHGARGNPAASVERRAESRHNFCGHKLIMRQRRSLGILHLRDMSRMGACGITDMPLAVGSIIFLELKKGHFYAAEVKWTRNLTAGFQLFRPIRAETMTKLLHQRRADD